jgi:hypothetical protein
MNLTPLIHALLLAQAAPTSLAEQETSVPGGSLLLISYIGLWLLILGFVILLLRQQRATESDLDELERRLDELANRAAPDEPRL